MQISNNKRKQYTRVIFQVILATPLVWACGSDDATSPVADIEIASGLVYIDKSCATCDFVIDSDVWKFDGIENNVQPGDTIGIPGGQRDDLYIINVEGTEEQPVVFINCDGKAQLGLSKDSGKGLHMVKSKHVKI